MITTLPSDTPSVIQTVVNSQKNPELVFTVVPPCSSDTICFVGDESNRFFHELQLEVEGLPLVLGTQS